MITNYKVFSAISFFCLCSTFALQALAYDDDNVHPAINEASAKKSTTLIDALQKVGIDGGLDRKFIGKSITRWLREGGTAEDSWPRPINHFHDPLQEWGSAGILPGESSLRFAQDTDGNAYTWQKARAYYYDALAFGGEEYFAKTFKTLGQVLFLTLIDQDFSDYLGSIS